MKRLFICTIVALLSFGCTPVRYSNRTADELRTDKYFVETWSVEKNIQDIAHDIYTYNNKCGNILQINVDPKDKKHANAQLVVPGWSAENVLLIIEFSEVSANRTTVSVWDERKSPYWSDKYKRAIAEPARCE